MEAIHIVKGKSGKNHPFSLVFNLDKKVDFTLEQNYKPESPGIFLMGRNSVQIPDLNQYCPPTIHIIGKMRKKEGISLDGVKRKMFLRPSLMASYIYFLPCKTGKEANEIFEDLLLYDYESLEK